MGIFSRRKSVGADQFQDLANTLATSFEALREEYFLGSLMQLKREGVDVSKLSRDITLGSELEDLLKGFQLTCVMEIAWDYIRSERDQIDFEKILSSRLGAPRTDHAHGNTGRNTSTVKDRSKLYLGHWRVMCIGPLTTRSHVKSS